MAPQTQPSTTSQKRPRKRSVNGRTPRSRATGRARSQRQVAEIGELERIIRSLEQRVSQLTDSRQIRSAISGATGQVSRAVTGASDHVGDMVADTLTDVAKRLRGGATSVTGAARLGSQAIQKIGGELERRPLMTIAIALGIGFIAGMAGRRDAA